MYLAPMVMSRDVDDVEDDADNEINDDLYDPLDVGEVTCVETMSMTKTMATHCRRLTMATNTAKTTMINIGSLQAMATARQ